MMSIPRSATRFPLRMICFFENWILSALAKMKYGKLLITLPSGQTHIFGGDSQLVATIDVKSDNFFRRCILYGDVGFGESYVAGEWETDDIRKVISWMILNRDHHPLISGSKSKGALLSLLRVFNQIAHFLKGNSLKGSVTNISSHYDLSNNLFSTFLDPTLTYSCADFSTNALTLEEAQYAKFDRLASSLKIKKSDHVLEIGSGWGAFAIHLAKRYGCRVTTITLSREQLSEVQRKIRESNLSEQVEARFQDYRNVREKFDRVVSIEMLEAVGHKHLPEFFSCAEKCLKPNGLLGIQVITSADCRYNQIRKSVDWIQKHIFPGSLIPSMGALSDATRKKSKLQLLSLFDMKTDYAKTLSYWRVEFNAKSLKVKELGFNDEFIRKWNYYFSYCEAAFQTRHIQVVQTVYTRPNNVEV